MGEHERRIHENRHRKEEADRSQFGEFVSDEIDKASMGMVDEYCNHTFVDFK